jgi:hypothetical protein
MTILIPSKIVTKHNIRLDKAGYFIINLFPKDNPKQIDVEYYSYIRKPGLIYHKSPPKLEKLIITKLPDIKEKNLTYLDIIRTLDDALIDVKLQPDHYAYLGKEVFLAFHCLVNKIPYTQDVEYK